MAQASSNVARYIEGAVRLIEKPRLRLLLDHFALIKDNRAWRIAHPLPEVLLLVVCGTIGFRGYRRMRRIISPFCAASYLIITAFPVRVGCICDGSRSPASALDNRAQTADHRRELCPGETGSSAARQHGSSEPTCITWRSSVSFLANRRIGRDTKRCAPIRYNVAAIRPF